MVRGTAVRRWILAASAIGAWLPAQTHFVSPAGTETLEGADGNTFPWGSASPRRYLQLHDDIPLVLLLKGISFRQDGGTGTFSGTRVIDCELHAGLSRHAYDQLSVVFDDNYEPGTKTLLFTRKLLNFGPQGAQGNPSPFQGMQIPFDVTFLYGPTRPLLWETNVHANPAAIGFNPDADAHHSAVTLVVPVRTGLGCVATGRTARMTQESYLADVGGILTIAAGIQHAPSATPLVLAIGTTNPNVVLPGVFCGGIYTDALLTFPAGTTDALGALAYHLGFARALPNQYGGLRIYTQQHAIDLGLPETWKWANSDGLAFTIPMPDLSRVVRVSRLTNLDGTAGATRGSFLPTNTIGYGLVTRFER